MIVVELLQQYPKASIIIVSAMITFVMTLVYKYTTNQERLCEIKKMQKEYQEKSKALKSQPEKMMEIQKKMLELSTEMMKCSFKPMMITMLPMFVLIIWLKKAYAPVLSSWIWYYIVSGIILNSVFRRMLKVQ